MKKFYAAILILAVLVILSPVTDAQENAKTKYLVWEVELTPLQLNKAIDAIKAENAFYMENNFPFSNLTQYSNDGYLWYSIPITKYADIDDIETNLKKLREKDSEKSKEIEKNFDDTYQNINRMILESQPELSIPGAESATTPTGSKFRFFEKFHIQPGKHAEFEKIVKRYVELRKKHQVKEAFYTFYPTFAPNLNIVYFIDETGNNPAEHYEMNGKQWEQFGEEGQQLWTDVMQVVNKVETHLGQINFDLMYVPSN